MLFLNHNEGESVAFCFDVFPTIRYTELFLGCFKQPDFFENCLAAQQQRQPYLGLDPGVADALAVWDTDGLHLAARSNCTGKHPVWTSGSGLR